MTDNTASPVAPIEAKPAVPANEKQLAMLVYGLQALSLFLGITSIVGLIVNYVKRGDLTSDVAKTHFSWQIRTFWWSLVWALVGLVLLYVGIGLLVLLALGIWYIYRIVFGFIRLNENRPI